MVRLIGSNFGNVLKAIRDDEIAAKNMGINTFFFKVTAFTVGAFFAGVGGALMGSLVSTIDPKMFAFTLTFNILMITVAGGLGSITGSLVGSAVITVLLEWLRIVENPLVIGSFEIPGIPGMRMVIFSLALILIILYRSDGIMNRDSAGTGCSGGGGGEGESDGAGLSIQNVTMPGGLPPLKISMDAPGFHHGPHRPERRREDHHF